MPKDEFDFEDPFELNGMTVLTHEDTTDAMAETFIEEFMRMGYNHRQLLALFRDPQYLGPNMALEKRGEPAIRELIAEVFARWGIPVAWSDLGSHGEGAKTEAADTRNRGLVDLAAGAEMESTTTDPMGAPLPKLNV